MLFKDLSKEAREYLIELDRKNNEYLRQELLKLFEKNQHDPMKPQFSLDVDNLIKEIKKRK